MKKPEPTPAPTGEMIPIGRKVSVLRPNLWFGTVGKVTKHDGNHHWIEIPAKDGDGYFHGKATLEELKEIK